MTWDIPMSSNTAPVQSVFGRIGAVVAAVGDYTAAQVTNAADTSSASTQTFTGNVSAPAVIASGLTGATSASRYVGATASGAPVSGTFAIGDFVIDRSGKLIICTAAGTPGTWATIAPQTAAPVSSVFGRTGAVVAVNSEGEKIAPSCDHFSCASFNMSGEASTPNILRAPPP